jgi:hypothetical protein
VPPFVRRAIKPSEQEQQSLEAAQKAYNQAIEKSRYQAFQLRLEVLTECLQDEACAPRSSKNGMQSELDAYLMYRQFKPTQRDIEAAIVWQNHSMLWLLKLALVDEERGNSKAANQKLVLAIAMPWDNALTRQTREMVIEFLRISKQHQPPVELRKYLDPCAQLWKYIFATQFIDLTAYESLKMIDSDFCQDSPGSARRRLCKQLQAKLNKFRPDLSCQASDSSCEARHDQIEQRFSNCPIDFFYAVAQLTDLNPSERVEVFERLTKQTCSDF